MIDWFKGLNMVAKLSVVLTALALVAIAVATINHFIDVAFQSAEETGAANVRVIVAEEGMSNVKNANEAAAEVKRDPVLRHTDCVRDSRTPENC
jgi:riboflavin synthase